MQLVPMTESEFDVYLARLIPHYAAEHVAAGNWSADEAEERATQQVHGLLPEGAKTPGHYLYTLRADGEDAAVGMIWLALRKAGAFIFDIEVYETYRRRGYAMQAMTALEDRVRELGANRIALHVFAKNASARALYEKLGYVVTDISMAKAL
jgi:GNAT superfamily N-acetyltransferase